MTILWISLGLLCVIVGVVGSVLPFLPGPPIAFAGLLLQQLNDPPAWTSKFVWIWAAITVVVTVLDYVIPIFGTKRSGGTKYGVWGCTIGLIAGLWFGPLGIIIGPFVGAFVGEMLGNQNSSAALKAAWGSFMGFLFGTLLKLIVCFVMGWYLAVYAYNIATT